MIMLGLIFISFMSVQVLAFGPPSVESNNDGIKRYKAEEYQEAFTGFADALARDPFNPKFHLNLGDTFLKGGDYPKAMAEFDSVDQNPKADSELKFQALFNAGNAAVEAKDIPKALQYYQKALEYKPDSIETKTNIELALKEEQKQKNGQGDDKKDEKEGGGKEDQKDQKKNKDDKGKDEKKDQNQNKSEKSQEPTPRPKPQAFKSQELNENDVRRILDELKRQEEEIRARQYKENKNVPESQIEKDW